jgi:MoxR-like ATPase
MNVTGQAGLDYTPLAPTFSDDPDLWRDGAKRNLVDRRDGAAYRMQPEIQLAIDVAMATGRPLLLRGEPGSGKSSLAPYLARNLGARYLEAVVAATSRAEDFLWRFDTVKKLSDAQARRHGDPPLNDADYLVEGVLWRAFDPDGKFGSEQKSDAVVLIDEIDKADPDVPNSLLVPLGAGQFSVPTREKPITIPPGRQVIVVITTNEERQLPPAFLRRCVVAAIPPPTLTSLQEIARLHTLGPDGGEPTPPDAALFAVLAEKLLALRAAPGERERPPGIAEYLDAVRACRRLGVDPLSDSPTWRAIETFSLRKPTDVS